MWSQVQTRKLDTVYIFFWSTGHCVLTDTNQEINEITEMSQAYNEWTSVEMDLYLKGAKLFGKNRYKNV